MTATPSIYDDVSQRIVLLGSGISVVITTPSGDKTVTIKKAEDPPPPRLDSGDLPALWVFSGQSTEQDITEAQIFTTRIFRVQVAVLTLAQGDPWTRERYCRPLMDAMMDLYHRYPKLNGLAGVRSSDAKSNSGIVILPEYGAKFIGFETRLEVVTYEEHGFAPGE